MQKCLAPNPGARLWLATTKAKKVYTQAQFGADDFIMFGRESAGIPEEILMDHADTCIRIPMLDSIRRSLICMSAGAPLSYSVLGAP